MSERYDVVVLGAGPAGGVVVSTLASHGMRVALVERELVGGECAYWACIPSKTLLRPAEVREQATRAAGVDRPERRWTELAAYRDFMIRNLDDSKEVEGYRDEGVEVLRGDGAISGRGSVRVAGRELACEHIVVATGSETATPAIDGLAQAGFWTNRQATTLKQLPDSVIVLGGGPVGIELGQFFARFGVQVTLVHAAGRLLGREEPAVSELIAETLRDEGIDLRMDASAESVLRASDSYRVRLSGGDEVRASELLVATGRRPRVEGIGLETVGIEPGARGIEVDERCRAGEGVWAVGDVTGVMPFTHVGMYQARIAAADITGRDAHASYGAIPRVVFSDPEIASVGLTTEQARAQGIALEGSRIKLSEQIARPWTYEQDPHGELGLLADRTNQVLIGAWAVAPLASEWIHQAALAIKTRVPLAVLRDTVAQFPTFSEAYLKGLEALSPL